MSRHGMPWYKTESRLHRDSDYLALPLAQQAVYRNLLDYANEQRERGSFSIKSTRVLSLAVSLGDEQLLKDVLAYASSDWTCEDGTTSIVIEGDTARFSQWAHIQKSYPSDEPEAVAERVRKHRSKASNDDVTSGNESVTASKFVENRIEVDKRREDSSGRGESEGAAQSLAIADSPERTEAESVLALLDDLTQHGVARTGATVEAIGKGIKESAQLDPLEVTLDYVRWQETLPAKKRHKDVVRGWRNQMLMRKGSPQYYRAPEPMDEATYLASLPHVPPDLLEASKKRVALIEANSDRERARQNGHTENGRGPA